MPDPLDFTGKVVLVTGSSRGIGAETIKAFGERGAKCVVNYVTDPEGKNKADAKNVAQILADPLVIKLSSVSGQMGLFGQANYSSSKAAIMALTKVSARELARNQITVNAVAPGFIDVGMTKGMSDEVAQNFIKQIPLGRLGQASE